MEKETIELVKKMIEDGNLSQEIAEKYCPELKESEDERIRKALMQNLKERFGTKGNMGKSLDMPDVLAWLEKQGEKKSVDKVEPKLKVGNWYQCTKDFFGKGVTFDKNTAYYCAKEGCLQNEYGCHIAIVKDLYDNFKLWTIQDAKPGDVLTTDMVIFIFKEIKDKSVFMYCCHGYNSFAVSDTAEVNAEYVHPATKEQRDLLFQKMKEAGYEWDAGKKELKKIEQRSEEDEEIIDKISIAIANQYSCDTAIKIENWLKSLRPQKPLTNEEIEQAKKEYRDVALSKMDYIPEELTYDNGWDDAISYIEKVFKTLYLTESRVNENG